MKILGISLLVVIASLLAYHVVQTMFIAYILAGGCP